MRASTDPLKRDLELTCNVCKQHVCDVEHGDELTTLTGIARDHALDCVEKAVGVYTRADWKHEVAEGYTVLGYEEWVEHSRERDKHD